MKKFFKRLSKYYTRTGHCVKYYLQEHTFSFAVYSEKEAFVGKPLYESKVYYHQRVDKQFREEVLADIKRYLKKIEK